MFFSHCVFDSDPTGGDWAEGCLVSTGQVVGRGVSISSDNLVAMSAGKVRFAGVGLSWPNGDPLTLPGVVSSGNFQYFNRDSVDCVLVDARAFLMLGFWSSAAALTTLPFAVCAA